MKILEKLTNIIMPIDEFEEEEVVEEHEEIRTESKKVVNGNQFPTIPFEPVRPALTVHTTPSADLSVKIHVPHEFGDVRKIADDLKAKRAVIVNFEEVEPAEQRRICDFTNGVCYMMDGQARRISECMVLYVPAGVSVAAVTSKSVLK